MEAVYSSEMSTNFYQTTQRHIAGAIEILVFFQFIHEYNFDFIIFFLGERNFSLLHSVQIGSGANSASFPMDIWDTFPGVKATGA
jgi:hypothetical protein